MANAAGLQELSRQLDSYRPDKFSAVTPLISEYISHYGCAELFSESQYSIGFIEHQGYRLAVQAFTPASGAYAGNIFVLHGYMDHAALYRPLCLHLVRQGWRVVIYDLPGHGLSGGHRHAIDDFRRYGAQLEALLEHEQLRAPPVLLGQSTGAAVILEYLRQSRAVSAAQHILLAPLVRPAHPLLVRCQYRLLHRWLDSVPRVMKANTSDAGFMRFIREQDPLQHKRIPVCWVGAMLAWGDQLKNAHPMREPAVVIQGEQDATVAWRHNLKVLARVLPGARQVRLPAAQHNLVNEGPELQAQVFGEIDQALAGL